jgi:hypothetical protein
MHHADTEMTDYDTILSAKPISARSEVCVVQRTVLYVNANGLRVSRSCGHSHILISPYPNLLQPTLHIPAIMAHRVRKRQSGCTTPTAIVNPDSGGDEMNCHFPQSDLARAEAQYIAKIDLLQYIVPTDASLFVDKSRSMSLQV